MVMPAARRPVATTTHAWDFVSPHHPPMVKGDECLQLLLLALTSAVFRGARRSRAAGE